MWLVRTESGWRLVFALSVALATGGCASCVATQAHAQANSKDMPQEQASFGKGLVQDSAGKWVADRSGTAAENRLVTFVDGAGRAASSSFTALYAQLKCESGQCAGVPGAIEIKLPGLSTAGSFSVVREMQDGQRLNARWWVYATGQWPTQHTPELSGGPQYRPGSGTSAGSTTAVFADFDLVIVKPDGTETKDQTWYCVFLLTIPDGATWPPNGVVSMTAWDRYSGTAYPMQISSRDANQQPRMFRIVEKAGVRTAEAVRALDPAVTDDKVLIDWLASLRQQVGVNRNLDKPPYN